ATVSLLPAHLRVRSVRHSARAGDLTPNTEPYDSLAACWDEIARWLVPRYAPFVAAAGRRYGVAIRSALHVACGTGVFSRTVAGWAGSVGGLDQSGAMLRRAEQLGGRNVRYVQGDFRSFWLGETFDAAVCGGDSLNYVRDTQELADVLRCVRRHLRP